MRIVAYLLLPVLLGACSTHPITGREQILALPAVQLAYADAGFALYSGAQRIIAPFACEQNCSDEEALRVFARRVAAIGGKLGPAVHDLSPDLFERIGRFRIEVIDNLGVGTAASAGGHIALGSGLARLEATDTVIAFLIAREMAHVIARHGEENSGASLLFSTLGLLLPGVNVVVRFFATTLGSNVLKSTWALQQQREADQIAVALLARTGLSAIDIADNLEIGLRRASLPDDEWGARYLASTQHVAWLATLPPRT